MIIYTHSYDKYIYIYCPVPLKTLTYIMLSEFVRT